MDCATESIEPERADRSCGFLKKSEREHLMGEKTDISDAYKSTLDNQVQTRTKHALADFTLLAEYLDEDQKQRLVDASLPQQTGIDYEDMTDEEIVREALEGPLRFFADITLGEEEAGKMFSRMEEVEELRSSEEQGFVEERRGMMEDLVEMLAKNYKSKRQVKMAIDQYWPAGQR